MLVEHTNRFTVLARWYGIIGSAEGIPGLVMERFINLRNIRTRYATTTNNGLVTEIQEGLLSFVAIGSGVPAGSVACALDCSFRLRFSG